MKLISLAATLLSCFMMNCAMEMAPCSWNSLCLETKAKIMACVKPHRRPRLRRINHELSKITTQDLACHSPLLLTRRQHIECMIGAAIEKNECAMKNLCNTAHSCDHEDVLDWLPIFYTLSTSPLEAKLDQLLSKGDKESVPISGEKVKKRVAERRRSYREYAQKNLPFVFSFYRGDQEIMNEYMRHVGNVEHNVEAVLQKLTPLIVAIHAGSKTMVELLLMQNKEIVIGAESNGGYTPLHVASIIGSADIVQMVLEHSPFLLDAQDRQGYTALMYVVKNGHKDAVRLLLRHKPNYRLKNRRGDTVRTIKTTQEIMDELFWLIIDEDLVS